MKSGNNVRRAAIAAASVMALAVFMTVSSGPADAATGASCALNDASFGGGVATGIDSLAGP